MIFSKKMREAVQFASHKHKNQKRNVLDYPYITHPLMVMYLVSKFTQDETVLIAAILHDTIEDTDASLNEVEEKFGKEITYLVDILSEDKDLPKKQRKEKYYTRLFQSENKDVFLIKSADILYNMNDMIETLNFRGKEGSSQVFVFQDYFDSMYGVLQEFKRVWKDNPFLDELYMTYETLRVFYEKNKK